MKNVVVYGRTPVYYLYFEYLNNRITDYSFPLFNGKFSKTGCLENWNYDLKRSDRITKQLPPEERYSGSDQIKRAASSILVNIAEASGRYTYKDKTSRYIIARGECYEVVAFIYMFLELNFIQRPETNIVLKHLTDERKILSGLISANRKRSGLSD